MDLILDLKDEIEESVLDNQTCEEFLRDTLGKSPDKMPAEHLNMWQFAFKHARNWNRVIEQFKTHTSAAEESSSKNEQLNDTKESIKNDSHYKVDSLKLNNENKSSPIKKPKSKLTSTTLVTDIVYQEIEKATIVIEFYTYQAYGKKLFFSRLI